MTYKLIFFYIYVYIYITYNSRMGITPKLSVVQPTGETWEVKNLYVADGSVFPTAVGVNPMVTIEAIAIDISRNIIANMNRNKSRL